LKAADLNHLRVSHNAPQSPSGCAVPRRHDTRSFPGP